MNKKIIVIVLLLISFSLIYQNLNIIGYSTFTGESFESGGRTITIIRISQNNVVVDVNGVKNIISIGDKKIINGIQIKVLNIFYVSDEESRSVELSTTVMETPQCGDGKCDYDENSDNCCIDCDCKINYMCKDEECIYKIPDQCKRDSDCDDNNTETFDLCIDTVPNICKHYISKECKTNEECNDNDKNTIDECVGGLCTNTEIGDTTQESKEDIQESGEKVGEEQGFFSKLINFLKNLF